MIVKKIKRKNLEKPKEWQISDLVDYIRNPSGKCKAEKIEHSGGLNFLAQTHAGQKFEMIALARETVRSKMPVAHWIFSWPEGEQPTHEQVDDLVKFFLNKMGLAGHQAIYALHGDTKNYHVHIAVNRVSPVTYKVVRTNYGFDIREAQKIRALLEQKQGWAPLENAPYIVTEEGEVAKRITPHEPKPTAKAVEFEMATGEKSAQRIAQEKGCEIIKNATSWEELHNGLKKVGLRFEKKGSGAIVWVGETAVKASSVDRSFSMGKLVKRLGEFVAGNYEAEQAKPELEPLATIDAKDWQIYRAAADEMNRQKAEAIKEHEQEQADLKQQQGEERTQKLSPLAIYGVAILNIARHCLKLQHRKERKKLRRKLRQQCARLIRPRFREWIMRRKRKVIPSQEAERQEETRHTPPPPAVSAENAECIQIASFLKYAEAVNAERYRVTAIRMDAEGNRKVFILDKKDGQTLGFTREEMIARMPELLNLQKRGENIYYTPLSEDKHHILIDDVTPENVVKLQNDGYKPAAILESSPDNFQCILTFPKFGGAFDRQIANRLTTMLNKKYGDPKLSGAIHPHRAPGFENRKPKHRRPDGSYPVVYLRYANRQDCKKAIVEARKIEQALASEEAARRRAKPPTYIALTPGNPQSAYFAHYENIRSHISIEDFSRVDAMIALRMRANGHSPEAVFAAIRDCAPEIREGTAKRRNWPAYAERTMNYAFGYAGDRDLLRYQRYAPLWQKVENNMTGNNMAHLKMR